MVTDSGSLNIRADAAFKMLYSKDGMDAATVYTITCVREVFARFFVADTDKGVRSFRYDRIMGRA